MSVTYRPWTAKSSHFTVKDRDLDQARFCQMIAMTIIDD